MQCACDAAFSCFTSTVGLVLPFVLVDPASPDGTPGEPISNAESATVVWINQGGLRRNLTLSYSPNALFTYTTSAGDVRSPHLELGYLEVRFDTNCFPTSAFAFNVVGHF